MFHCQDTHKKILKLSPDSYGRANEGITHLHNSEHKGNDLLKECHDWSKQSEAMVLENSASSFSNHSEKKKFTISFGHYLAVTITSSLGAHRPFKRPPRRKESLTITDLRCSALINNIKRSFDRWAIDEKTATKHDINNWWVRDDGSIKRIQTWQYPKKH